MFDKRENQLLAALDPTDYALIRPHLSTACFERGVILQEQEAPVVQVYFPMSGLVSLVSVMPIFYSWRGSTWHKSLILLGAGWHFRKSVVPRSSVI